MVDVTDGTDVDAHPKKKESIKHSSKSVVRVRNLLEVSNDGELGVISKRNDEFVNHEAKDTHHGGTSVVELNSTLLKLGLLIKVIPAKVDVSIAEVTGEFSVSGNFTHEGAFQDTNKGNDLDNASGGDGVGAKDGGNTVGEGVKAVSGVVDVSGQVNTGTGGDLAKEGKHTDTAVLDFDVTETVKTFLSGVSREKAKGIEEAKRRLGTKLVLKCVEGGGGSSLLANRSESSGRGNEGGKDSGLHVDEFEGGFDSTVPEPSMQLSLQLALHA
jgi:hypothetical protein